MSSNEMGPIIQLYHVLATLPLDVLAPPLGHPMHTWYKIKHWASLESTPIKNIRPGIEASIGHALKQPPMDLANSELSFI